MDNNAVQLLAELEKYLSSDPEVARVLAAYKSGLIPAEQALTEIRQVLARQRGEASESAKADAPRPSADLPKQPVVEIPKADVLLPESKERMKAYEATLAKNDPKKTLSAPVDAPKPLIKRIGIWALDMAIGFCAVYGLMSGYFWYKEHVDNPTICLPEKTFTEKYSRKGDNLLEDNEEDIPDPRQMDATGKGASKAPSDGAPWPSEVPQDVHEAETPPPSDLNPPKHKIPDPIKEMKKQKAKKFEVEDVSEAPARTLPKKTKAEKKVKVKKSEEGVPDVVIPADDGAPAPEVPFPEESKPAKKADVKKADKAIEKATEKSESTGDDEGWPQ